MPAGMPIDSAITIAIAASCERDRQLLQDQLEHRLLDAHRLAEVAREHAARSSTGTAPAAARRGDTAARICASTLRVALLAGHDQRRIARQQLLQPEDQHRHEEQRRDDLPPGAGPGSWSMAVGGAAPGARSLQLQPCTRTSPSGTCAARRASPCGPTASCGGTGRRSALLEHRSRRSARRPSCARRPSAAVARPGSAARRSRAAVARIVQRLLAAVEAEQVAVRVGAAAPGQHVGLELALVGQVQRGRELGRPGSSRRSRPPWPSPGSPARPSARPRSSGASESTDGVGARRPPSAAPGARATSRLGSGTFFG